MLDPGLSIHCQKVAVGSTPERWAIPNRSRTLHRFLDVVSQINITVYSYSMKTEYLYVCRILWCGKCMHPRQHCTEEMRAIGVSEPSSVSARRESHSGQAMSPAIRTARSRRCGNVNESSRRDGNALNVSTGSPKFLASAAMRIVKLADKLNENWEVGERAPPLIVLPADQ